MEWLFFITCIFVLGGIFAQNRHYDFKDRQRVSVDRDAFIREVEEKLRDFDSYKKRVDTLSLKAGFKL